MRRLICNYLKIIFRSPLYRLAYLFLLAAFSFFSVCFNFYLSDDTVNYFDGFQRMEYFEFALYIVAFCMAGVFCAEAFLVRRDLLCSPQKNLPFSSVCFLFGSCNGSFHCVDLSDNWGGCRACDDFLLVENYFICILSLGTDSKLDDNDRIFLRLDCHKQICIFVFHSVYVTVFGFQPLDFVWQGNFGV